MDYTPEEIIKIQHRLIIGLAHRCELQSHLLQRRAMKTPAKVSRPAATKVYQEAMAALRYCRQMADGSLDFSREDMRRSLKLIAGECDRMIDKEGGT